MNRTVIINPASAAGRTGRDRAHLTHVLRMYMGEDLDLAVTAAPGDAFRLAHTAALKGASLIVAVGGDGTVHEVVNGMFAAGPPSCELGIVSAGSGCGFAQSLGLPLSIGEQCAVIAAGNSRAVDVGRIRFSERGASSAPCYFVNECQIGIGAEVVRRTRQGRKRLGGLIGYALGTISAVLCHDRATVSIDPGNGPSITRALSGISIGNGARTGGGMRLTPEARLDDARLDILMIHDRPVLRQLLSMPSIYARGIGRTNGFSTARVESILVRGTKGLAVSADGELVGTLPCTVEVVPAVLRIRM